MASRAAWTGARGDPRRWRNRTRANALPGFHADPADRIIVATAQCGHRQVTGDERLLAWDGNLARLDARE